MTRFFNEKEIVIISYSTESDWYKHIPEDNWACLMVVDQTAPKYLSEVIPKLISKNIGSVCIVGNGCEMVHDLFDEEIALREVDSDTHSFPQHTILTVWNENFEEGVWFGINNAQNPDVVINKIVVLDMTFGKEGHRVEEVLQSL